MFLAIFGCMADDCDGPNPEPPKPGEVQAARGKFVEFFGLKVLCEATDSETCPALTEGGHPVNVKCDGKGCVFAQ